MTSTSTFEYMEVKSESRREGERKRERERKGEKKKGRKKEKRERRICKHKKLTESERPSINAKVETINIM